MSEQAQRRLIITGIFVLLVVAIVYLIRTLITSVPTVLERDAYMQGVILTAMTGAIGSLLTLVSIIVKGLVDNLTSGGNDSRR